jgi:ADP-ribose pyrophosphatase YjhB (NUDIX family)
MNKESEKIHLGIYGVYIEGNDRVLMIKKARGPYKGKYDLPGGRMEFGETIEEGLRREFMEEVGIEIRQIGFLGINEYKCQYEKEAGVLVNFHHVGIYHRIQSIIGEIKIVPDGEDSNGALFIPFSEITPDNTSPIAYPMIKKAIEVRDGV